MSGARPVDLKNGEADLAIRSGPITDEDLVASRLCEMGWSLDEATLSEPVCVVIDFVKETLRAHAARMRG